MRSTCFLLAAVVFSACTTDLPHEAPFDAKAPLEKQMRGQVTGRVQLEGETDASQVSVQLVNAKRTYSVDSVEGGSVTLTGVVPGTYALTIGTRYFQGITESIENEAGSGA